ncbi:MAG: single-stranded DNA-binding protein [Christensenellales bacterium]|jgi:single-strand DNA-binding protein
MNKAFIIGNLTRDPEARATQSGISKSSFTVAVNRRFTNQAGERETDFLPVVAWRGLADTCNRYLYKGSKVAVAGMIQTRSYDAQDGTKRYVTEIVADEVQFLDPKGSGGGASQSFEKPSAGNDDLPGFTVLEDDGDDELPF